MDSMLGRLAETPRTLAHLVADATDARLDESQAGAWTPRLILAHLRDEEFLGMRPSLERILAEDLPQLTARATDRWERDRNRSRDRKEQLLASFALQRQASLDILRSLGINDLARPGRFGETVATIRELTESWVRHDDEHIAQLEAALGETLHQAVARRKRPPE